MALQHRSEQRRHPAASRKPIRGGRRTAGRDACRHGARADEPQHHRPVGSRPEVMQRNRHEAPLGQIC